MNMINLDSVADIVFQLKWCSDEAGHTECYAARGVNLWRDWLPEGVREAVLGRHAWEKAEVDFTAGELFGSNGGHLKIDRHAQMHGRQVNAVFDFQLVNGDWYE